jgi:microcystin-dependent protein
MTTTMVVVAARALRKETRISGILFIRIIFGTLFLGLFSSGIVEAQNYYVGEIRMVAFNTVPSNWMECNGQTLQISSYSTLFFAIGTTYGGDGTSTFVLPNLNGRVAVGAGQGSGLSSYSLGQSGGQSSVTLTVNQIPSHSHTLMADTSAGTSVSPSGYGIAENAGGIPMFVAGTTGTMVTTAIDSTGSSQPHNNMMPYLGMKFIIAVQ